jgi:hypothetical protein
MVLLHLLSLLKTHLLSFSSNGYVIKQFTKIGAAAAATSFLIFGYTLAIHVPFLSLFARINHSLEISGYSLCQ